MPADELVQIANILDGYNRYRFTTQPELLAAWIAARNVRAADRRTDAASTTAPQPGQIQPAA